MLRIFKKSVTLSINKTAQLLQMMPEIEYAGGCLRHDPYLRKSSSGFFVCQASVTKKFTGETVMYQYFIQQIINKYNQSVIGYELLLKQYTDQGWRPPHHFNDVPADVVAGRLVKAAKSLSLKVNSLSVNLNRTQVLNQQVVDALIEAQTLLRPTRIQVELTEEECNLNDINDDVISVLKQFIDLGIEVSIDDVDCGCNTEHQVKQLIPFANEIKFALQNFDQSVFQPVVQERLLFWRDFAYSHKVRFVLEGIENEEIDRLIDSFEVDIRQGYYYEKPHPITTDAGYLSA